MPITLSTSIQTNKDEVFAETDHTLAAIEVLKCWMRSEKTSPFYGRILFEEKLTEFMTALFCQFGFLYGPKF
ncbi:hypothetical protein BpHYR1_013850 [Brachionus plicatilis]|uniref:Uncharacterized protein n=1 Tax=Brachionus plicatilis TaxID=10195 RepID=A0A3M7RSP0_BRAPC|nr:hypothetical protein BpHYR1_013850 [Brachionus plicatilis]